MKTFIILLSIVCSSLLGYGDLIKEPIVLDQTIPVPPNAEILKDPKSQAHRLKALLDAGDLKSFYLSSKTCFDGLKKPYDKGVTKFDLSDCLWCYYYYVAAPLFSDLTEDEIEWLRKNYQHDLNVKCHITRLLGKYVSDDNKYLKPSAEKLSVTTLQLSHLLASYYAAAMKTFYDHYDRWWFEKMKKHNQKMFSSEITRNDWNRLTDQFNGQTSRNNEAGTGLRGQEEDFIKLLLSLYPKNLAMVKKYIFMAGYQEDEYYDLIDFNLGKTPEATFLLRGVPKPNNPVDYDLKEFVLRKKKK